ncbi:uncharacterized protein Dana_GF16769 [Drosophila ananassae]|uniref:EF-hand domain-containing protein n=1 Tax=Drosophila ananassae TaxID=7217 RepID=B3LYL4_DROAN|nr:calmodulin [Drosophila ananassae]EDV42929.1 uncharacterized protein Dana_GF16769 [Drosophila ananassae]
MEELSDVEKSLYLAMNELNVQKLEDFKHSFDQLHKNERGVVTVKELGSMIRSMGVEPTDAEVEDIFKASDVDGNGEIDFKEFCYVMALYEHEEKDDNLQIFKMFDKDGDGYITEEDLLKLLEHTDLSNNILAVRKLLDSEKDGRISCEQFMSLMSESSQYPQLNDIA